LSDSGRRFLLLLVIGGFIGFRMFNEKTPDIVNKKPDAVVNAQSLVAAFDADTASAVKQYLDKIVEVTGTVKRIDTTGSVIMGEEGMASEVVIGLDRRSDHQRIGIRHVRRVVPEQNRRATRCQRIRKRILLHIGAADRMALIEQDMCDRTHARARDADDVVAHSCLLLARRRREAAQEKIESDDNHQEDKGRQKHRNNIGQCWQAIQDEL